MLTLDYHRMVVEAGFEIHLCRLGTGTQQASPDMNYPVSHNEER